MASNVFRLIAMPIQNGLVVAKAGLQVDMDVGFVNDRCYSRREREKTSDFSKV